MAITVMEVARAMLYVMHRISFVDPAP